MTEQGKAGRPSIYCEEIVQEICVRISMGESLRRICEDDHMPARSTVFEWLDEETDRGNEFRTRYTRARERQAENDVDELKEIADDGRNDWMEKHGKEGELLGYQLNGEHVSRSKLRIETRRWIAEKLKPKKYGSKIDVTSGGEKIAPDPLDAAARAAALMALARQRRDQAQEASEE